jgi:sugar phosphate isomerase/epimerase
MATKKVSIQLFTVRESLAQDPGGTVARIGQIGYAGVEPFNIPTDSAADLARIVGDADMVVSAYQGGTPAGDDANQLLDDTEALGTDKIVCPYFDREQWTSLDQIKQTAELFNTACENAKARGLTFGYHNHEFELAVIDGKPGLLHLAELCPDLHFTVDTYWVKVGGQDPVEIVKTLGDQANLLHIKDGPGQKEADMLAAGTGIMDFPPIVAVANSADWLVVELDRCGTDMFQAVEQSYRYLVDNQLAEGR